MRRESMKFSITRQRSRPINECLAKYFADHQQRRESYLLLYYNYFIIAKLLQLQNYYFFPNAQSMLEETLLINLSIEAS